VQQQRKPSASTGRRRKDHVNGNNFGKLGSKIKTICETESVSVKIGAPLRSEATV
jgi:hypothetical protein